MGFFRDVRKGMRTRGLYLDAHHARTLLGLAKRAQKAATDLRPVRPLSLHEEDVLRRFAERCKELES